jgi:Protein of unknown function (DUF2442)
MRKLKVRLVKFSPEEMAYDVPPEVQFKPNLILGRGIHARLAKGELLPKAKFVAVDDESLSITLTDGRKLVIPLDWYPRLRHGTPAERNTWRLVLGGIGIVWRQLEQVINVESALAGEKSKETPAALKEWLDSKQPKKRKKTA